jgi:hypothetical protein
MMPWIFLDKAILHIDIVSGVVVWTNTHTQTPRVIDGRIRIRRAQHNPGAEYDLEL